MEPLEPEDPRRLGPYVLLGVLGEGGMGRVLVGRSAGGRTVAIKVVRREYAGQREFRSRFRHEVRAARAVQGSYTAAVIDADVDGPRPWLATAYVPGRSLSEVVADHGPLPVDAVRTLAHGLALALVDIHAAGLVHRDLKPSNILLTTDGPVVIDFGIARAAHDTGLTRTGVAVGSPGYLAPEQIRDSEVTPRADVFALGATLVFAATGRSAFGSGTDQALMYRVVHEQPDVEGVPEGLRPLVEECLSKEPGARPGPAAIAEATSGAAGRSWLPAEVARSIARATSDLLDLEGTALGTEPGEDADGGRTLTAAKAVAPQPPETANGGFEPRPVSLEPSPGPPARDGRRRRAVLAAALLCLTSAAAIAVVSAFGHGAAAKQAASGSSALTSISGVGDPTASGVTDPLISATATDVTAVTATTVIPPTATASASAQNPVTSQATGGQPGSGATATTSSVGQGSQSAAPPQPGSTSPAPPIPGTPVLLGPADHTTVRLGSRVTLSWTATGTQYRLTVVHAAPGGAGDPPQTGSWQSATSLTLAADKLGTYTWGAWATDDGGIHTSPMSPTRVIDVVDGTPPSTPVITGYSAAPGPPPPASLITVTWSASTDNVGVASYRVYRNGTQISTVSGSTLSYSDQYDDAADPAYQIQAVDASGNTSSLSVRYCNTGAGCP